MDEYEALNDLRQQSSRSDNPGAHQGDDEERDDGEDHVGQTICTAGEDFARISLSSKCQPVTFQEFEESHRRDPTFRSLNFRIELGKFLSATVLHVSNEEEQAARQRQKPVSIELRKDELVNYLALTPSMTS